MPVLPPRPPEVPAAAVLEVPAVAVPWLLAGPWLPVVPPWFPAGPWLCAAPP